MLTCPGRRPETTHRPIKSQCYTGADPQRSPAATGWAVLRADPACTEPRLRLLQAHTMHTDPAKPSQSHAMRFSNGRVSGHLTPHDPRALCCSAQMLHTPAHTEGQSAQPPARAWPAQPGRHSVGPSAFIATVRSSL